MKSSVFEPKEIEAKIWQQGASWRNKTYIQVDHIRLWIMRIYTTDVEKINDNLAFLHRNLGQILNALALGIIVSLERSTWCQLKLWDTVIGLRCLKSNMNQLDPISRRKIFVKIRNGMSFQKRGKQFYDFFLHPLEGSFFPDNDCWKCSFRKGKYFFTEIKKRGSFVIFS